MNREKPFKTEVDLCAAFITALPKDWTAYAETANWDILLVRKADGCQIGIEAKLKLNPAVLCQAAEMQYGSWAVDSPGPDYRAVLVPAAGSSGLAALARYCAVTVIFMLERGRHNQAYQPSLPDERYQYRNDDWQEMMPSARCRLPEYLPDVAAGASAPIQLTDWKIKALKLLVLLDDTGYVTRSDFKRFGLDIRRWIGEKAWLEPCEKGFRARGDLIANFRSQHPRVWQEIVADRPKWDRRVAMLL